MNRAFVAKCTGEVFPLHSHVRHYLLPLLHDGTCHDVTLLVSQALNGLLGHHWNWFTFHMGALLQIFHLKMETLLDILGLIFFSCFFKNYTFSYTVYEAVWISVKIILILMRWIDRWADGLHVWSWRGSSFSGSRESGALSGAASHHPQQPWERHQTINIQRFQTINIRNFKSGNCVIISREDPTPHA